VVRVNTDTVTLQVERVLAEFGMAELIHVEIRPSPYPSIDHMRKPFSTSHLCMYECVECVCTWMCAVVTDGVKLLFLFSMLQNED